MLNGFNTLNSSVLFIDYHDHGSRGRDLQYCVIVTSHVATFPGESITFYLFTKTVLPGRSVYRDIRPSLLLLLRTIVLSQGHHRGGSKINRFRYA